MIRAINDKTPRIAPSVFVSEAAYVVGDVEIDEGSSVWPCAVIRADFGRIRIGRNTAVEDNCIIHAGYSPRGDVSIGNNVVVGHGAVIHSRRIGNSVLIGMNATVLYGAEIGDCCIIGAGSLIEQGRKIPDNSIVVGVPGKVRGRLSQNQLRKLQEGNHVYTKLAMQYKEQGL